MPYWYIVELTSKEEAERYYNIAKRVGSETKRITAVALFEEQPYPPRLFWVCIYGFESGILEAQRRAREARVTSDVESYLGQVRVFELLTRALLIRFWFNGRDVHYIDEAINTIRNLPDSDP